MKKLMLFLVSSLLFFSGAAANSQYAYLTDFKTNLTIQADTTELVKPSVAVARGQLPSGDARHYKMIFSDRVKGFETLKISPKAKVTLLTFPSLAPKATSLENLRLMLSGDEALPSEFERSYIFKYTQTGKIVTSIAQVNTRAVTGVFEQAVLISKKSNISARKFVLDFVNIYTTSREMQRAGQTMDDNPGGMSISNTNPLLRTFSLAKSGRIKLLKTVGEYFNATLAQLEAGLNGQTLGYFFSWETHFYATISDVTNEMLELKQGYEP